MSEKEPIRLTREQAHTCVPHIAKPAEHREYHHMIDRIYDTAEGEGEGEPQFDPKDVQVGDVVQTFCSEGAQTVCALMRIHGEDAVELLAGQGEGSRPRRDYVANITRIVTRATPRVKDTVKGTLDGITKHGFVYESPHIGEPMVKWDNGHYDYLSVVAPRLRIVHRPEG